jgi:hypothetical protein
MAEYVEKQVERAPSRRWGQARRFEFIEFRLLWDGRLNRADLTSYFGISTPQASMDLAAYQRLAPDNLRYDKQQKAFTPGPLFRPLDGQFNPYSFLNSVRQVEAGMLPKEATFLGWYPANGVIRLPTRRVDFEILRNSLAAIRNRDRIAVRYQSMHHPEPETRSISPHAIVFDGVRWHLRSYCFRRQEFRDFVLSRVSEIESESADGVDPALDHSWHTEVTVQVAPAPHLSESQRNAIAMDYGMSAGSIRIPTREALLLYLLQQLPLYSPVGRARFNQIVLMNESELRPSLDRLAIHLE